MSIIDAFLSAICNNQNKMEQLLELKEWVKSLNPAEKRFIKLIGKARSGNGGSQHLDLLDQINNHPEADFGKLPYARNLSMVTMRLKELIEDALRLLHKDEGWDAVLQTHLADMSLYYDKGWIAAAYRLLKRAKESAMSACRYDVQLQLLTWERRLLHAKPTPETPQRLSELGREEQSVLVQYQELLRLTDLYEALRAEARQIFRQKESEKVKGLFASVEESFLERASSGKAVLPKALAVIILAIRDTMRGNAVPAMLRLQNVLQEWRQLPEWQYEHGKLLATISNYYQLACFYTNLPAETTKKNLDILYEYKSLRKEGKLQSQRVLLQNQLRLALNTGNFAVVNATIPDIQDWLVKTETQLGPHQSLTMLGNMAIAEFLQGRFVEANRFVIRIQQVPDPKARQDIRDFARLLQTVLQHELGDHALNEYLARAGKRHFSKQSREQAFELAIFKYLEAASRSDDHAKLRRALEEVSLELEQIAERIAGQVPLMGLMEMRIWSQSKLRGIPIKQVFVEVVEENLKQLG